MRYGATRTIKYLLGTDIAGRHLAVFPDDTFIVSYPRSGNTWTRFLIANLLHPDEAATFANIERWIPDAEAQSSRYMKSIAHPRFIKSHEYFDHRYKKVIYIVRDPRDIAVSYYHFQRKYRHISDDYGLERYVDEFVAGRPDSADWGTWGENVGSWLGAREGHSGFLLLKYEDMTEDTVRELAKVARFFGIEANRGLLEQAVERSSAARMRELEKLQGAEWISTKDKRPDIPFVRGAEAGGWKRQLHPRSVARIESAWATLMTRLGYSLSNSPVIREDDVLTAEPSQI